MNNLNSEKGQFTYIYSNKLKEIYYHIMKQFVFNGLREPHLVQLLFYLLLFIIAVFIAAGVFVGADGRLNRIVAQEHFCFLVQIIEPSRFRPVQPLKREQK